MEQTWYADKDAKHAFKTLESAIGPELSRLFPGFAFTHFGVNRVQEYPTGPTKEVRIVFHMRPIFEARAIHERLEATDMPRLK